MAKWGNKWDCFKWAELQNILVPKQTQTETIICPSDLINIMRRSPKLTHAEQRKKDFISHGPIWEPSDLYVYFFQHMEHLSSIFIAAFYYFSPVCNHIRSVWVGLLLSFPKVVFYWLKQTYVWSILYVLIIRNIDFSKVFSLENGDSLQ